MIASVDGRTARGNPTPKLPFDPDAAFEPNTAFDPDAAFDPDGDLDNPGRIRDDDWWADRAEKMRQSASIALGDPDWTIDALNACGAAASMIAWLEYRHIGAMHTQLAAAGKPEANKSGTKLLDAEAQTATRIAMTKGCTQRAAEKWLGDALTMRDRLRAVGMMLRAGIISPRQFRLIAARTDLIDGFDWSRSVDAAISDLLYRRRGTWSNKRLGDMVDRIIFRHDPDAVRRRHQEAKDNRSVWVIPEKDGMATLGVSMTGQEVKICIDALNRLADAVCEHDPRTSDNRRSDAVFALLSGMPFECDCGRDDCAATLPDTRTLMEWVRSEQNKSIASGGILVHVIAEQSTIDGADDNPAFMDGHGVISAAHLRDLLDQPETRYASATVTAPFLAVTDQPGSAMSTISPSTTMPTQPTAAEPTRTVWGQSAAPTTSSKPTAPVGSTTNGAPQTGAWSRNSSPPEGIHFPGPAETNEDLFLSLKRLTWHDPIPSTENSGTGGTGEADEKHCHAPRPRNRTKAKHARRRREREANRRLRLADEANVKKAEDQRRHDQPRDTDGPPPF